MASAHILELTDQDFDKVVLKSRLPVLVDFWAPWCGPCRAMAPTIEQLSEEYAERVLIGKVNVDEAACAAVSAQFRIASIPTLMLFVDGFTKEKMIGLRGIGEIRSVLDRYTGKGISETAQ